MNDHLARLRVCTGVDAHPLVEGRRLVVGGVEIPHGRGLEGHSDGDVVAHAVTDAVLAVAGAGDIGTLFPSDDPALEGADSIELLRTAVERVRAQGVELISLDVTIVAQEPRMAPYRDTIADRLADATALAAAAISVKATTTDHLGFTGRGEGIAALVTCSGLAPMRHVPTAAC